MRVVAPITGWDDRYEQHLLLTRLDPDPASGLTKPSAADALQIRTMSILRFGERLGKLPSDVVDRVAKSIAVSVGAPK